MTNTMLINNTAAPRKKLLVNLSAFCRVVGRSLPHCYRSIQMLEQPNDICTRSQLSNSSIRAFTEKSIWPAFFWRTHFWCSKTSVYLMEFSGAPTFVPLSVTPPYLWSKWKVGIHLTKVHYALPIGAPFRFSFFDLLLSSISANYSAHTGSLFYLVTIACQFPRLLRRLNVPL
jgi:hypothetical protein